uniref:Coiled-coil domain-containing protein 173 isoform X2 n=1 Tax=Geotrypetes seraphini TaxID=260995 RepID=A0A6P8RGR1_GEOSA|nr:coiled-coil domain-containing protein 173 isoform X2 [Geotrypetes seraphini]
MSTTSTSVVQYGRRKGWQRENTEEELSKIAPTGELISKGIDLRQVTVLPKQEWERIQDKLNNPDKELKRILAEVKEKKDLHLRSKEVVKNWTNTITSGLLLTQVMKEREAQIELKKKMDLIYKKKEQEPEGCLLKERRTEHERFLARKAEYDDLLEQIEQHIYLKKLEKQDNIKEGKEIQRMTRLYEQEMQQKHEQKQQEKMEQMKAYRAYVTDRDLLRALEKQNIEEEDEKIRLFVKAKQNLLKLRKEKEMEIQRNVESHRNRISEFLFEQLKEKLENEDERIARSVAELEENKEQENRRKEEKQKRDLKAIAEHREAMRQRKEKQEKEDKLQAVQNLQAIQEADWYFLEQQKEKMKKVKDDCMEQQNYIIQQMVDKKTKLRLTKEADRDYERQNEAVRILEEKRFQEYAQDVINSALRASQNPYPLLQAARAAIGGGHGRAYLERGSSQLSYQSQGTAELPTYHGTTTEEIKNISDTKDNQNAKK